MVDPVQFYIAIFALAALAILLVAAISFYLSVSRKYIQLKAKVEGQKSDLAKEHDSILSEAQKKAIVELDQARQQAQKILTNANLFNTNQENLIKQELDNVSQNYAKVYSETLNQIKIEAEQMIKSISGDIGSSTKNSIASLDKEILDEIGNFKKDIGTYLIEFQNSLKGLTDEERKRIKLEFEEVKKEKIANLDKRIVDAVGMVSQEFIEKALSTKEHEEMVIKALEKAKEEGFFS